MFQTTNQKWSVSIVFVELWVTKIFASASCWAQASTGHLRPSGPWSGSIVKLQEMDNIMKVPLFIYSLMEMDIYS